MNSLASFSFLVVSILKLFLGSQLDSDWDIRFGSVWFGIYQIKQDDCMQKNGLTLVRLVYINQYLSYFAYAKTHLFAFSILSKNIYIYTVCVSFKNCFLKLFSFAQQKHFSLFSPKSQLTALRPFLEWNQQHWGVGLG